MSPIVAHIGSLCFRFESTSTEMLKALRRSFERFLDPRVAEAAPFSVRIEPVSGGAELGLDGTYDDVVHDDFFRVGYRKDGETHIRVRAGIWTLKGEDVPLQTSLLNLLSLAAIDSEQLLVHGGAVRLGPRAVVFVGKSGAGKSTLAHMFPPEDVLNDEFVLLDGQYVASTPFFGTSMMERVGVWDRLPVASILTLTHSDAAALRPLDAAEALPSILRSVAVPEFCAGHRNRAFNLAVRLPGPRHELAFSLDPEDTKTTLRASFLGRG